MARTALVLETNPVIRERYVDYTHESDWRIMLKDSLNSFLEKLQHEKFNLIVAEESLLPQGIIQMMKATGIPFLLATNTKNPEIPTLPRNFNRTELLTVFNRLVPEIHDEPPAENTKKEDDAVNELLSGLEDEEETFELTSDAVVTDNAKTQNNAIELDLDASAAEFFGEDDLFGEQNKKPDEPVDLFAENDKKPEELDDLFGENDKKSKEPVDLFGENDKKSEELDDLFGENDEKSEELDLDAPVGIQNETSGTAGESKDLFTSGTVNEKAEESKEGTSFVPPSFDGLSAENSDIDSFVNSLALDKEFPVQEENYDPGEKTLEAVIETTVKDGNKSASAMSGEAGDKDFIKAEVSAWLEKNARSIIKEIVLEQLASLSGKKND